MSKVNPEYIGEQGELCLPPLQFWKWRALDSELERQKLAAEIARREFEEGVKANPALYLARQLLAEALAAQTALAPQINALNNEIVAAVGVELEHLHGIDDVTGAIHLK